MSHPAVPSNYSIPAAPLSNLTISGPGLCGIPLSGPLNKTEVTPNEFVTVSFHQGNEVLRAPFRVYGVVNNRVALTTSPSRLTENPDLQCMQPFDILGQGLGFGWQVIDRNFTSKENGTVGVNPGDFVWFHAVPLGETDAGQGVRFWTSNNYTVVDVKKSGSAPAVAAKSGLILLAGVTISTLVSLAC